MSLDALFRPRSIAVIGASSDATRIGGRPIAFSKRAFKGAIVPINPNRNEIQGLRAYPSIKDAPGDIDQAIIAVPAKAALQAADECIAKGVKAAVMFSSGFAETGDEGRALQQELARRCAAGGMTLLGPNSLGMFNVHAGLYSTFSSYFDPLWPHTGPVGIVSQSGAFGTYFLSLAVERGLGFSHFVATGNEAGVDVAACVEWLADDPDTGVIMVYLEGCRDGARLRAALARAAANRKPVVAMKVGVSEQGVAAIASHTGSLAGSDAVFDAVFRENNVHRAQSLDELVDVAYACAGGVFPQSPRLGVVTLSGGVGIQMADAAVERGLTLPRMPDTAQQKVLAMIPFAGPANPVDTTAQVVNDWAMFTTILGIVAEEGAVDSVVSFLAHMGTTPGLMDRLKSAFLEVRRRFPDRVFVLCARMPREMADEFTAMGFLIFEDPTRAIAAVAALARLAQGFAKPASDAFFRRRGATASCRSDQRSRGETPARRGRHSVRAREDRALARRGGGRRERGRLSGGAESAVVRHRAQVGGRRRRARPAQCRRRGSGLRHDDGARRRACATGADRRCAGRPHDRGRCRDRDRRETRCRVRPGGDVRAWRGLCRGAQGRNVAPRPGRSRCRQRDDPRDQGHRAAHRCARQGAGRSQCTRRRAGGDVALCGGASQRHQRRDQSVHRAAERRRRGRRADHDRVRRRR